MDFFSSDQINQLERFDSTTYMPIEYQVQLIKETRAQYNTIVKSAEMEWLGPKIKQIWFCLLTFENLFEPQYRSAL